MRKTDLSHYNNSHYHSGAGFTKRILWHFVNGLIFKSHFFPINFLKIAFLKLFGAKIGDGVIIKPAVNIKYPWFLEIGNNTWVGENVWIDNLTTVKIGHNCCLSQGAMLLTGNHNFKSSSFDLIFKPIVLEDGVWICAQSIVCPGIICHSHSILQVCSVAKENLQPYSIYSGNAAVFLKMRVID